MSRRQGKRLFTTVLSTLEPVIRSVRPCRDEKTYQDRLADKLAEAGIEFEREVRCGTGFVDFEVLRVLVEVKTEGNAIEAARQAVRYCASRPDAVGVIVVHSRGEAPKLENIGGKPVVFLNVAFANL